MKINNWYILPFLVCILLLACRKFYCEYLYLDHANIYNFIHGGFYGLTEDKIPNPYNIAFNSLRNCFISTERFMFISTVAFYFLPKGITWRYFIPSKPVELRIPMRFLIIYWQYSFGDFVDRVFFNYHEYGFNDLILHIYVIIFLTQTIRLWFKR